MYGKEGTTIIVVHFTVSLLTLNHIWTVARLGASYLYIFCVIQSYITTLALCCSYSEVFIFKVCFYKVQWCLFLTCSPYQPVNIT